MEEIIGQIEKYHQLSIWCFTGMILCGLITWLMYRKKNIREMIGYYRRKRKRKKLKLWSAAKQMRPGKLHWKKVKNQLLNSRKKILLPLKRNLGIKMVPQKKRHSADD